MKQNFLSLFNSQFQSAANDTLIVQDNVSDTECLFGRCPYKNGVCCLDGYACCPEGRICIPFVDICIEAVNKRGKPSLRSEKAVAIRNSVSTCPPGWTECGNNMCCPYEKAVCCEDGKHCCPNGYK